MISLANKGRTVNRYDRDLANTEVVSVGNYVGYTVKSNTVNDSETIKPAQTFWVPYELITLINQGSIFDLFSSFSPPIVHYLPYSYIIIYHKSIERFVTH